MSQLGIVKLTIAALTGRYEPQGEIEEADCIFGLAMGFSRCSGIAIPGAGNIALAQYIADLGLPVPWLVQDDLAVALAQLDPPIVTVKPFGQIGQRYTSVELLEHMSDFAVRQQLRRPLLVASRFLAPRAVAIVRQIGWHNLIVPAGLPAALDPKSAQWWTRRVVSWAIKEPLVITHHRVKQLA